MGAAPTPPVWKTGILTVIRHRHRLGNPQIANYGKRYKILENTEFRCQVLTALCVSHFSTSFWEVTLMPAISIHSTMNRGLLAPLKDRVLDYHATTNLAGCSRLLHRYSLVSIKYKMLVALYIPLCLPQRTQDTFPRSQRQAFTFNTVPNYLLLYH